MVPAGFRPSPMKKASPAASDVKFSNLDKVFFPETGFTKGDLIQYYLKAAPYILPHLKNRPVTLIRFPDGVTGEKFYEKNAPKYAPEWIKTFGVARRHHEGEVNYIVVNDARTLAWCANLAAIEFHPFLHRIPQVQRPTHVAFDLDPGEGSDLLTCIRVARLIREILSGLKLEAFPKVSGSKGLQLYVPLNTAVTYEATAAFAKSVAELLTQQHPDLVVSLMQKTLRKGRVLIDWSQNAPSKTTVGVYSVRGKHEAPFVSAPVTWEELEKTLKSKKTAALFFTPAQALKRMDAQGDLFEPVLKLKQKLPKAFTRIKIPKAELEVDASRWSATSGRAGPDRVPARTTAEVKARPEVALHPSNSKSNSLSRYAAKRNFKITAEPGPELGKTKGKSHGRNGQSGGRFVIQKHAASHLHYDFRLEMDGTLKSWAVPKGLSTEVGVKRAAFEVEDHPISYMKFEGTIPHGQYGGGTVMVWDLGTYQLLGGSHKAGDLKLLLAGKKLKGEWHLFRIKNENNKPVWLIAKAKTEAKPISARQDDASVLTRRSMARIAKDNDAQWQSKAR
jgi:bifunctional non-homologous end joining protein LigD